MIAASLCTNQVFWLEKMKKKKASVANFSKELPLTFGKNFKFWKFFPCKSWMVELVILKGEIDSLDKAAISAGQLIVKSFQYYIGHRSSKLQLNYVGKMSFFPKDGEFD